ncbi:MAG: flagellar basal body P-ring protein FlgI [Deltaproteobacteria bacterium]|nr:flagellar basal body P-ring protein FlgI [Deltaproteobacteria bacterium]
MRLLHCLFAILALTLAAAGDARAERLKDLTEIVGARPNQLVGYGIVVGLDSTGDGQKAEFTLQSVAAMLRRLGVRIDPAGLKLKNAAAVIVTSQLPAFSRVGGRIDVVVSSLGDARSIRGGTLVQTPLRGADRQVYAVAQGPISVGGFSSQGRTGSSKTTNHPTVGRIPGGALIERDIPTEFVVENAVRLALRRPDALTASVAAAAINEKLKGPFANADDPGQITVRFPAALKGKGVELLAQIGDIDVTEDGRAVVVLNERTGTVVIGSAVRLKAAAVAHGGLTVEIKEETRVEQPAPLSMGHTAKVEETTVNADTQAGQVHLVPEAATVGDLVNALNALGVKPSDLIVIFQSLAAAGALSADIEVQ